LGWSFEDNILYHDITLPQYLAPLLPASSLGRTIDQRLQEFRSALGFAWALGKDQKTVVRSSISLHHISPNCDFYKLNQRILFGPAGNGLAAFTGAGCRIRRPVRRAAGAAQLQHAGGFQRAGYDY
jgi:hypothetical protein